MQQMDCIEILENGGPEVLAVARRPIPEAVAGEVLIRVRASGVNRPDVFQRQGGYPPPAGASDVPGLEVAGEIVAGDEAAMAEAGLAVGMPVCALLAGGGYAQYAVAPVRQCLPLPEGLSLSEAASLPETFFTVWSNVFDRGQLVAGETLLVHGGSSGIGVTAIQMAKAAGARVIVTAGSDEKCAACIKLGADHAINYKTADFVQQVWSLTDEKGADVILDMVAGDYVERNVKCAAVDGRIVIIALLGGVKAGFNAARLMTRRIHITGSTLRARSVDFKSAIAQALRENVWPWLADGRVKPVIFTQFDALAAGDGLPNGAARAHALMESSRHIGKIVLNWEHPA